MSRLFDSDSERPSELISRFVDGDPVNPRSIVDALAAPEGRELLLDFLVLRERLRGELDQQPSAGFYSKMDEHLSSHAKPRASLYRLIAVAALCTVVGAAIGVSVGQTSVRESAPPPPSRTLRFEPGTDWYAYVREQPTSTSEEP